MKIENEREAQLLADFRNMAEIDRDFLIGYAKASAFSNANSIPAPQVLNYNDMRSGLRGLIG